MGLIKAEQAPSVPLGVFSMADIEKQARAILAAASTRAHRLLLEAQREADELKRSALASALIEGRKEGIAKGVEEGKKLGRDQALAERRQELANLSASLVQAALELEKSRIDLHAQARQAVVELAIAIAGRVSKRQGDLDPLVLQSNIDEALKLVVHSTDVRIAVHPSQKDQLAQVWPAIGAKWPNLKHVELIADGTLAPGGCRIFSGGGQIDADLDLQLTRIATELLPAKEAM